MSPLRLDYWRAVSRVAVLACRERGCGEVSEWAHVHRTPEGAVAVVHYYCGLHAAAKHTRDEDCIVGEDHTCRVCGVDHSGECRTCKGRGFHREDCALERAACSQCGSSEVVDEAASGPVCQDCIDTADRDWEREKAEENAREHLQDLRAAELREEGR